MAYKNNPYPNAYFVEDCDVEVTVQAHKQYTYVDDDESPVEHILTDEMERNTEEDIYQNKIGE